MFVVVDNNELIVLMESLEILEEIRGIPNGDSCHPLKLEN